MMDYQIVIKFWRKSLDDEAFLTTIEQELKGALGEAWEYDTSIFQGTSRISNTYQNDFSIARSGRALDVVDVGGVATCQSVVDGTDPVVPKRAE